VVIGGFIGSKFTGGRATWIAGLIGLKSVFCTGGLKDAAVIWGIRGIVVARLMGILLGCGTKEAVVAGAAIDVAGLVRELRGATVKGNILV